MDFLQNINELQLCSKNQQITGRIALSVEHSQVLFCMFIIVTGYRMI
jgi:hypothetical protein